MTWAHHGPRSVCPPLQKPERSPGLPLPSLPLHSELCGTVIHTGLDQGPKNRAAIQALSSPLLSLCPPGNKTPPSAPALHPPQCLGPHVCGLLLTKSLVCQPCLSRSGVWIVLGADGAGNSFRPCTEGPRGHQPENTEAGNIMIDRALQVKPTLNPAILLFFTNPPLSFRCKPSGILSTFLPSLPSTPVPLSLSDSFLLQ